MKTFTDPRAINKVVSSMFYLLTYVKIGGAGVIDVERVNCVPFYIHLCTSIVGACAPFK